jgi:ferric-dicitrate binding protein FerR (iron transport regulator)
MKANNKIQSARSNYLKGEKLSDAEKKIIENDLSRKDFDFFMSDRKPLILPEEYSAANTFRIIEASIGRVKTVKAIWLTLKYAAAIAVLAVLSISTYLGMQSGDKNLRAETGFGETKRIELTDGTVVTLNSRSTLAYPSENDKSLREVILSGEAYFDVAPDPRKPFIVKAGDVEIRVTGTQFNINAYENEEFVTTTLFQGSVSVHTSDGSVQRLDPGQQAVFAKTGKTLNIEQPGKLNEFIEWKTGIIFFNNQPLKEIIKILERTYDVSFSIDGHELFEIRITARFTSEESVENILDILGESAGFTYDKNNNTYRIKSFKEG